MNCNCNEKSTLNAINTTAQALTVNNFVAFASANVTGRSIVFSAGTVPAVLKKKGIYLVIMNANILGTAAGPVTLQLLNNNTAVNGANATVTTAAGDDYEVSFSTVVKVCGSCCCCDNTASLQVQLQTTDATINSIDLTVVKLD